MGGPFIISATEEKRAMPVPWNGKQKERIKHTSPTRRGPKLNE